MDFDDIRIFFSVVEHRNLSAAANALRISQPTLSRRIRALEAEFNSPLFTRNPRGMAPTQAGERLHAGLQGLERQFKVLREEVISTLADPTGEVAFGIPPSPRKLLAVPLLTRYSASFPSVILRVVEDTSGALRDLVANGSLDLAVTNLNEPLEGVVAEPIGKEPMLVIGPKDAGLSLSKEISLEQLTRLPLILTRRPNSLRLAVDTGATVRGRALNVRLEVDTLPLMTDLVVAGLGYTVLPMSGVRDLISEGSVTASPIAELSITWLIARQKEYQLSLAAKRFYETILEVSMEKIHEGVWQQA
jgi:LysR family nitrogen assimilation transcriptional regulator